MRFGLLALLALLALAFASPASAAITASYAVSTLTVNSDEAGDSIVVSCVANKVKINGANPPAPVGEKNCDGGAGTLGAIVVNGNGGNDLIDISGLSADESIGDSSADGGAGDDEVIGFSIPSVDTVTIIGGPGNDVLTLNNLEFAFGGSGDDRFEGLVPAAGKMEGEGGTDTVAWDLSAESPTAGGGWTFAPTDSGLAISAGMETSTFPWASVEVADLILNDAPQTADGRKFSGTMRVQARGGADTVYGTELNDALDAGADNDFIEGLGGADAYQGGSGFDRIHSRDGVADGGDCGSGDDTVVADAIDALVGCERIELPPALPTGPEPDTTKPQLKLGRATLKGKRLRLPISCPTSETRCTGVLTLTGVGSLGKAKKQVKLGAVTFSLAGGRSKTLSRIVAEKRRDTLDALSKLRLQVRLDVLDAAGNRNRGRTLIALAG